MPEPERLVTFSLDDHLFGIDVRCVQEIVRRGTPTKVPLADPAVRGMMNLRGQIVTVIDLKERLEFPRGARAAADAPAGGMNVVVRTDGGLISFQVDRIGDVVDVDAREFEPAPATVKPSIRTRVTGIYKLQDRLLHVLSVERTVDFRSRPEIPSEHARGEPAAEREATLQGN